MKPSGSVSLPDAEPTHDSSTVDCACLTWCGSTLSYLANTVLDPASSSIKSSELACQSLGGEKHMEDKELQPICDFCDALTTTWFRLKSVRCEGVKVSRSFELRMCERCYPKIHYPLRQVAFALMRQCFQNAVAKLKQDVQKAVEDRGTTLSL